MQMGRALWGVFFVTHLLMAGEVSYQETTKITGGSVTSMMKFAGSRYETRFTAEHFQNRLLAALDELAP